MSFRQHWNSKAGRDSWQSSFNFYVAPNVYNYYSLANVFSGLVCPYTLFLKTPQRVYAHHYHFGLRILSDQVHHCGKGRMFSFEVSACKLGFCRPWEQEDSGHQNNSVGIPISWENSAVRTTAARRRIAQSQASYLGKGRLNTETGPLGGMGKLTRWCQLCPLAPRHTLSPHVICQQRLRGWITAEITTVLSAVTRSRLGHRLLAQ